MDPISKNSPANSLVSGKTVAVLLLLLSGAFALVFLKGLDLNQVKEAFARLNGAAVSWALALVLTQIILQGTRFWILLPRGRRPDWRSFSSAFAMGQWVNLFAPARAGDVMKVVLLSSKEASRPLSVMDSTASLLADKLVDVLGLLILLLWTRPLLTGIVWSSAGGESSRLPMLLVVAVGALIAVGILVGIFRHRLVAQQERLQALRRKLSAALAALLHPAVLTGSLVCCTLAWLAECYALNSLCGALGFTIPLSGLVATLGILNLGIAVPLTFANLGPFEAAMAFALSRFNVPLGEALAIASAHHMLQMTGVTVLALFSWVSGWMRSSRRIGVSDGNKSKALQHYAGMAGEYNFNVEKGILKPLRRRERGMVLAFADFESRHQEVASPSEPRPRSTSMIDVGCGGGFYALAAKQAGLQVCAVDAVPEMVAALKDRVDRVEVADVESMSSTEKYDIVVCAGVLDFTSDPIRAFRNLCELVAPGGRLVLLAPRSGPGGLLYRIEKWFVGISVNCFSRVWWETQAAANGFELARLGHPLPTNSVAEFRRVSEAWGKNRS